MQQPTDKETSTTSSSKNIENLIEEPRDIMEAQRQEMQRLQRELEAIRAEELGIQSTLSESDLESAGNWLREKFSYHYGKDNSETVSEQEDDTAARMANFIERAGKLDSFNPQGKSSISQDVAGAPSVANNDTVSTTQEEMGVFQSFIKNAIDFTGFSSVINLYIETFDKLFEKIQEEVDSFLGLAPRGEVKKEVEPAESEFHWSRMATSSSINCNGFFSDNNGEPSQSDEKTNLGNGREKQVSPRCI